MAARYHSDNHGQAVRTSAGHDDVYPRVRLTTLCHRSVLQPVNNTLLEQPRRTGRASSHRAQPALCTSDRLEPLRIACHPRDSPGTDPPSPRCIFLPVGASPVRLAWFPGASEAFMTSSLQAATRFSNLRISRVMIVGGICLQERTYESTR